MVCRGVRRTYDRAGTTLAGYSLLTRAQVYLALNFLEMEKNMDAVV